jgi:TolB protein
VYRVALDGAAPINLTQQPNANDASPVWSPDGQTIVFVSNRNETEDLFSMRQDGSDLKQLTAAEGRDTSPNWSPDAQRIAFTTERDGNFEIYVIDAEGRDPTRLTRTTAYEWSPIWSPDGQWLPLHPHAIISRPTTFI